MITLQKDVPFPDTYPLSRLGELTQILFFDIETTGFSGEHSFLYLIGCTYYENGGWRLIQWFADTPDAEREVLETFFRFLKGFSILAHFNGDGFDIPYLLKRCQVLGLPYNFEGIVSADIYKRVRPYRKLLGMESMKQKAIEGFLSISREDVYSGGELIQVYKDYLETHEQELFDLLILHNEDDLKGMPSILPILHYPDFLEGGFRLLSQEIIKKEDTLGRPLAELILICESASSVPVPFSASWSVAAMEVKNNLLTLTVELFEGDLKYFYPNFRDYYYLIYEDRAIHKSVAEYVDKEARIKASAKTCYIRREGIFLPQLSPLWQPALVQNYKDKLSFIEFTPDLFPDHPEHLNTYIRHLFTLVK